MADQDRIDTLTANAWADEYREGGKVDLNDAFSPIVEADTCPAVAGLLLEWLQQPERRPELAGAIAEALADGMRARYEPDVQRILEKESADDDSLESWEYQESEKLYDWREREGDGI